MPRRWVLEGTISSQKPATSTPRGNLHPGNKFLRRHYFLLVFLATTLQVTVLLIALLVFKQGGCAQLRIPTIKTKTSCSEIRLV